MVIKGSHQGPGAAGLCRAALQAGGQQGLCRQPSMQTALIPPELYVLSLKAPAAMQGVCGGGVPECQEGGSQHGRGRLERGQRCRQARQARLIGLACCWVVTPCNMMQARQCRGSKMVTCSTVLIRQHLGHCCALSVAGSAQDGAAYVLPKAAMNPWWAPHVEVVLVFAGIPLL